MANSTEAILKVIKIEGGFVNDPADKGGATKYGITQRVYEDFLKKKTTVADIKNMPVNHAISIYKNLYWDKIKGDSIKDYAVAYTIFDQAVNRGVSNAIKQAQKVLKLSQDGIAGSNFIIILNKTNPKMFLNQYIEESRQFYNKLASENPSQQKFLKGWLNRVEEIKSYASKMLGTPIGKAGLGLFSFALLGLGIYLYFKYRKK